MPHYGIEIICKRSCIIINVFRTLKFSSTLGFIFFSPCYLSLFFREVLQLFFFLVPYPPLVIDNNNLKNMLLINAYFPLKPFSHLNVILFPERLLATQKGRWLTNSFLTVDFYSVLQMKLLFHIFYLFFHCCLYEEKNPVNI